MLVDRQQFHMGEAQVAHVLRQLVGQFQIAERAVVLFRHPAPRRQMHLVDGHGRVAVVAKLLLALHPIAVLPVPLGQVPHDRGGAWRHLGVMAVGVGLERQQVAVRADQFVLVKGAVGQAGNEDFPHAGFDPQPHGMAAAVPVIEIADHADAAGIGRPHGEVHARDPVDGAAMGAQLLEGAQMGALYQQVDVQLAQHRREAVGVLDRLQAAVAQFQPQAVGRGQPVVGGTGEHAVGMDAVQFDLAAGADGPDAAGMGLEGADAAPMRPQHGKGIAMAAGGDGLGIGRGDLHRRVLGHEILSLPSPAISQALPASPGKTNYASSDPISAISPRTGIANQAGRWAAS